MQRFQGGYLNRTIRYYLFWNKYMYQPARQLEFDLKETLEHDMTRRYPIFDPGNFRLLLIDDDQDQLNCLGAILERGGYEVSISNSARDAIDKVTSDNFNLIISDLNMPEMNGEDFVRALRGLNPFGRRNNLPLIILTSCDNSIELDLLKLGADMYCQKVQAEKVLLDQVKFLLTW